MQHGDVALSAAPPAAASPTRAILRLVLVLLAVTAGLWLLFALQGVILLLLLSMPFAYLIAPREVLGALELASHQPERLEI